MSHSSPFERAAARSRRMLARRLLTLGIVLVTGAAVVQQESASRPALAASSTTSVVGYLTDSTNGNYNLWRDGLGVTPPLSGGTYATQAPAASLSVTVQNIDMTKLNTVGDTQLSTIDTLVMFETCDIGAKANAIKAINAFVDAGHKVIILPAAQCTDTNGGNADFSGFIKPFTPNYLDTDPQQLPSTPYTFIDSTAGALTAGFPDCTSTLPTTAGCEPGNSLSDVSTLSANSTGWCTVLAGTSANSVKGPAMAYTHSPSGTGLILYEGESFAWAASGGGATLPIAPVHTHLRLVFDDMLTQAWNPDPLACARTARSLVLSPAQDTHGLGSQETLSATVMNGSTPVSGVTVTFTDLLGPNSTLAPQTATTGANGVASISYTSSQATNLTGPDEWQATYSDSDDHVSNLAFISWLTQQAQNITITSAAPGETGGPPPAVVGGPTYTVTADGGASGNPVVFSVDATATSVCHVSASAVSLIGVGTCVIDANQTGNQFFSAAPQKQQSFAVGKGSQTITFTSTAPANATVGGPAYAATATASSALPVVLTVDATASSICSLSGASVSFHANGTCVLDANQPGNANYNAASQVQQSFAVGTVSQVISFTSTAPANATVGGATYTVTATSSASGNPVVLTIDATAASVCSISGSTVSFTGTGTCTIDANQAGSTAGQVQQSFTVGKGVQAIRFTSSAPSSAAVGGPTYTVTATGGASGQSVTFSVDAASASVCAISGPTVSFLAAGTCVIDANQAGSSNYTAAAQVQQSFSVAAQPSQTSGGTTAPIAPPQTGGGELGRGGAPLPLGAWVLVIVGLGLTLIAGLGLTVIAGRRTLSGLRRRSAATDRSAR